MNLAKTIFARGLICAILLGHALVATHALGQSASTTWRDQLDPFLQSYCAECHTGDQVQGGFDLSQLTGDFSDQEIMRRWVLVHDRITAQEMPPAEAEQPTKAERQASLTSLASALHAAHRSRSDVVLRRLNRREYENTVRDLFGVYVRVQDILPEDASTAGFDNVGEGLMVSAEAAQAYLRAADAVLNAVMGPARKPNYIKHKTNLLDLKTHDGKPFLTRQIGKMFQRTEKGLVIFQSGYCPTNLVNFARLRPSPGVYRVRIQARAVQSKAPVTMRIYGGDTVVGRGEKHLVGYFDVPPEKWTTIEFEDRLLEAGGTFQPKCYGTRDTRKYANTYPEPGIEIGDITIEGPLEPWPPTSRLRLLDGVDLRNGKLADAERILRRLAPKAFRRPLQEGELQPYLELVGQALDEGRGFVPALRLGIKGLLCSPEFLFLDEPGKERVSSHALASRLSYFLWRSTPDERLSRLAAQGRLAKAAVLEQEVERLLKSPKSSSFVDEFTGQWLNLRDIDFTSPDAKLYPEFDELLKISMLQETRLFFRELLDRNLPTKNFIDADFAILNERLARHYSIAGVKGQAFRKVQLPPDSVRGGVLTQAAVLKVTANGSNTSPVVRGLWVMDRLMGWTAPPPPDNVSAVEPDIRGATTLRAQLAKHRDQQSCATCHQKIDPPGFALENFDAIGGWRENYRTLGEGKRPGFSQHPITFAWVRYRIGLPVDASGQMPDGTNFKDIRDLKRILLSQERSVARNLTRKLLTFALGRRLGFSDRKAVDQIVAETAEDGYRLRSLIHAIVRSPLFIQP